MRQYVIDYRCLVAQLREHLLGGYVLSCLGLLGLIYYLHLSKEYLAHLLGARYVEALACLAVNLLLYLSQTGVENF